MLFGQLSIISENIKALEPKRIAIEDLLETDAEEREKELR